MKVVTKSAVNSFVCCCLLGTFLLFAGFSFGQADSTENFATIYFLRTEKPAKLNSKVSINIPFQPSFDLPALTMVAYKARSIGAIEVTLREEGSLMKKTCVLELAKGTEYYVCYSGKNFEEEDRDYVRAFIVENSFKTINVEEVRRPALTTVKGRPLDLKRPGKDAEMMEHPEYSTVYILRRSSGSRLFGASVYLANQAPFNLESGELVAFNIYSVGEISIALHNDQSYGIRYTTLRVHRGHNYLLQFGSSGLVLDHETDVNALLAGKGIKITKKEENLDAPIYPRSLKDEGSKGLGQGTCFVISQNGYLVSNYHCVENAKKIIVKGIGGDFSTEYAVSVVASDPTNDLVLLRLSTNDVKLPTPVYTIRGSGVLQAEKIYALGYPAATAMGEELKITEGIISSRSGALNDISKFQISAPVNHGNSGGPLIDENGNVVGVIFAKSTIAESAGYAVKASYLETFLKNVDGFEYPTFQNTIQSKTLPEKVEQLRNYIYILESN